MRMIQVVSAGAVIAEFDGYVDAYLYGRRYPSVIYRPAPIRPVWLYPTTEEVGK